MKKDCQLYMRIVIYRYKSIIGSGSVLCVVKEVEKYGFGDILLEVIENKVLENKRNLQGSVFLASRNRMTLTEFRLLENLP